MSDIFTSKINKKIQNEKEKRIAIPFFIYRRIFEETYDAF